MYTQYSITKTHVDLFLDVAFVPTVFLIPRACSHLASLQVTHEAASPRNVPAKIAACRLLPLSPPPPPPLLLLEEEDDDTAPLTC